jgi:murein DD-endopeptidase MepM/ murein hydrolase activator NlpD
MNEKYCQLVRQKYKKMWLALLFVGLIVLAGTAAYLPQAVAQSEAKKPFILPFKEPPGPDTWLMAQPYGNTTGAYSQRDTTYGAGQGIHFGVDFSAPCGTEIVSLADGVVFAVDNLNFGSGPHNLTIDHPDLDYASFYGHLLEIPSLRVGQVVKQGEVVALSGDPAETCYGRPHLHLEVRDLHHWRKYNPLLLIEADWDNLALVGSFGRNFERDLDDPRKWQYLDDQPEVVVGGPLLNDFANPWPPDRRRER